MNSKISMLKFKHQLDVPIEKCFNFILNALYEYAYVPSKIKTLNSFF